MVLKGEMSNNKPENLNSADKGRFATTHWSVVLAAGSPESSQYRDALEALCRTYWYPIYVYIRRLGYDTQQAEDCTQAFFTQMLEKQYLGKIEQKPGRFRTFLLVVLKHFLADQRDKDEAIKRGAGKKFMPLEVGTAETRYSMEPQDYLTPERLFERSWALTVLEKTMDRLEAELAGANKQSLFDSLKAYLCGETTSIPYREVAAQFGMTEGAVKVSVHRLRRRYREILRDEIAQTVNTSEQIDEEIKELFESLSF